AGVPTGLRPRGRGRGPRAARARLARDEPHLVAGDRPAGCGRLRGDRPRPPRLRRLRGGSGRLRGRTRPQPGPPRAVHRARPPARRGRWRGPRRAGRPGPGAALPGLRRAARALQLAAPLRRRRDGRHAHPPPSRGGRLLPPAGHRRRRAGQRAAHAGGAQALHRHLLHVEVLGAPWRLLGCRRGRVPHRALRRRHQPPGLVPRLRVGLPPGRPVGAVPPRPQPRHPGLHPLRCVGPRPVPGLRPHGCGGAPSPRGSLPAQGLRPLRAVGGTRAARRGGPGHVRRPPRPAAGM
ncbi:MAG: hypothetical protein AVDCRST_MAG20-1329, partial [uncultured Acidimicrobiales bacterium]